MKKTQKKMKAIKELDKHNFEGKKCKNKMFNSSNWKIQNT